MTRNAHSFATLHEHEQIIIIIIIILRQVYAVQLCLAHPELHNVKMD